MAELRELQKKLDSVDGLREVVNAMRNLAAVYVRRAEVALEAMRPYRDVVETAFRAALGPSDTPADEADRSAPCLALVFASDQGLCGTYNDRVVKAALAFAQAEGGRVDFVTIGRRARDLLILRGITPSLAVPAPTSLEGIKSRVPELAADIFDLYSELGAERMVFVHNRYEGMGRFREEASPVLPPSRERLGERSAGRFLYEPVTTLSSPDLLGRLIEEYFFIQLFRALLEGHCSENGARLVSMTAASSSIDQRFSELTKEYQTARQDSITAELLDVVGGAEALRDER